MSFEFNCQACGAKLRIDDELAGKTVKCPKCSAVVPAEAAAEPAAGESPFSEVRPLSGPRDDSNPYASPASFFTGAPAMLIVAPMYLLYAALYLACSYYLFLYGSRIGSLLQTNSIRDLETALVAQKSFWKLVGILVAVMFVLGVLMMGGFMLFGILAGMNL